MTYSTVLFFFVKNWYSDCIIFVTKKKKQSIQKVVLLPSNRFLPITLMLFSFQTKEPPHLSELSEPPHLSEFQSLTALGLQAVGAAMGPELNCRDCKQTSESRRKPITQLIRAWAIHSFARSKVNSLLKRERVQR